MSWNPGRVSWWSELIAWIAFRVWIKWHLLPYRLIDVDPDEGPLLIRFYIFTCQRFSIYLHLLNRSDTARAMHDHPWNFWSLILSGKYYEHVPNRKNLVLEKSPIGSTVIVRTAGNFFWRPATWVHRLAMDAPCWTLVFHGRTVRTWGFVEDSGEGYTWWTPYDRWKGGHPSLPVVEGKLHKLTKGTD